MKTITNADLTHPNAATRRKNLEEHDRASLDRVVKHEADHRRAHGEVLTEEGNRRASAKSIVAAHETALEHALASAFFDKFDPLVAAAHVDCSRVTMAPLFQAWRELERATAEALGRPPAVWLWVASIARVEGGDLAALAHGEAFRNYAHGMAVGQAADACAKAGSATELRPLFEALECAVLSELRSAHPHPSTVDAELFALRSSFATKIAQDDATWAYAKRRETAPAAEAEPEAVAQPEPGELARGSWFDGAVDAVTRAVTSRVSTGPQ